MLFNILLLLCFSGLSGAADSGIVAGTVCKPHSRPYMVSLQKGRDHSCGGALVRADFVLTSAHCKSTPLTAVLGAHNVKKDEKGQQRIEVAKYYMHPNYKDGLFNFDIMLLKLKRNATIGRNVKTTGLPRRDGKIPANLKCSVAGWGMLEPNAPGADFLMQTTVKTQFPQECKAKWQHYFNSSQMICTHSSGKKGGICQGDSGGPLMCGRIPQGIAAFTFQPRCDNPKFPQVFMKIPYFMPWIKDVMKKRD